MLLTDLPAKELWEKLGWILESFLGSYNSNGRNLVTNRKEI